MKKLFLAIICAALCLPAFAQSESEPEQKSAAEAEKPYTFAIRTNVLYDALLFPTLGFEWRATADLGLKMDASLSKWGKDGGKVQDMWMLSPELRWYLLSGKRLYTGIAGNLSRVNSYDYPAVKMLHRGGSGYDGIFRSVGVLVGYQVYLCESLSLDLNIGFGRNRFEYVSYTVDNGRRIESDHKSKVLWTPTQANITLAWTLK